MVEGDSLATGGLGGRGVVEGDNLATGGLGGKGVLAGDGGDGLGVTDVADDTLADGSGFFTSTLAALRLRTAAILSSATSKICFLMDG